MTWAAVLLYAAAALALGWRSHRRRDSGEEFWTAGRSLGTASVGLSISAGFMSVSWSCVYAVQLFYGYGLGALWLITLPWLLALAGIFFLSRRYHALPSFSQPEMVGRRFGAAARRNVALALAAVFLVWGGAEIYVAALLLAPRLGLTLPAMVVGIGVVVGAYSALGGFRAVVATDKLQFGIVAVYVLAMAWLAARGLALAGHDSLPAGVTAATSGVAWTAPASPGWALILLTLVAYLPGWLFETDLWVRVQAARDAGSARRGVALAGVNAALFVGLLPLFIGVAALVLFPPVDGVAPPELGRDGDAVFAALVGRYAPPWLAALTAVGLVAAAMSTIDTCANVMALSIGYDLLGDRGSAGAGGARGGGAGSPVWVTVAAVAGCCVFALFTESLWDVFYLSGGVLTTAVAFPVAAVFWRRASPRGVLWSSRGGLAGTVLFYFLESRGALAAVEPSGLAESGLGYILWGLAAAALGYAAGAAADVPAEPAPRTR